MKLIIFVALIIGMLLFAYSDVPRCEVKNDCVLSFLDIR